MVGQYLVWFIQNQNGGGKPFIFKPRLFDLTEYIVQNV